MKRIRLTASAIAASSLGSLGLVGMGATSAHATTNPNTAFSGRGFDAGNTKITEVTADGDPEVILASFNAG